MTPHDFHGRDLIAEARLRWLGRLTERAAILLPALAFALLAAHAGIHFLTWETTTAIAGGDVQPAVQEIAP